MRLRSPAEFYIKFLVTHPDQYDTPAIRERLIDENLDFISDAYIDRLRGKMHPPTPFHPDERLHAASYSFLLTERLNRIYQPDVAMKMALEILNMPRAKEFAEATLLVQIPFSSIAAYITRHLGVYCVPEALELYKHYFWNINLLDSTQMRVLLHLRIGLAAEHVPEFKGKSAVLKSAYYKDPRKAAADLPHSPTTAMIVQMRLGVRPSKYELAMRILEARDNAMTRIVEAVQQDGPGDSKKFLDYATGSRILEELLQMIVRPEEEMRAQLQSIALRTESHTLPSIHELSPGGHHTVDVAPLKDPHHADEPDYEPGGGQAGPGDGAS